MLRMSYADCPSIFSHFGAIHSQSMSQPKIAKKFTKNHYFESLKTPIKSLLLLLAMISNTSVPICNRFYARKQLLLSARLSRRHSVRPFVRLSVARVGQSKTVQAKITKISLSAARKTLVARTVKLFHKFKKGHPERGR